MAANSSSVNTANIITALGNAFKDPSGAALPNERLAAVLIQNMNQLNDLAKQEAQPAADRAGIPMISSYPQSHSSFVNWSY